MRGVDPGSIGNVIDLIKNIEVGKFEYLENPEKLTRLPADEVIGLGPGGEPYLKGPDLSFGGSTSIPRCKEALHGPPVYPGLVVGREFAKTLHAYVGDEITLVSPLGDLGPWASCRGRASFASRPSSTAACTSTTRRTCT